MTYTVKTRGAGGWLLCEYRCPTHGVFEATVQRDANGDAPDYAECTHVIDHDGEGGVDECLEQSPWTISSPKPKVLSVPAYAAVRGGDMTDRPPHMLDQRDLADGKVTLTEWKKKQREVTRANRHKQLVDGGVISKKVQVG